MSTIIHTKNNAVQKERLSLKKLGWVGPAAGVVAAVANLIVFFVAKSLFGIPFVFPLNGPGTPAEPLPAFMVVIATLVPALAATVFLAILSKFAPRPVLIFQIVAVVFLLLSFGGPFSLPVDLATKLALSLMHVIAGVVIVGGLTTLGYEK